VFVAVGWIMRFFFSYEGTIWDDYAHGKGVYVSDDGLVRFVFAPLRSFF